MLNIKKFVSQTTLSPRLAAVLALSFATAATAQDFPNSPIRITVPYTAGGVTDVVARHLGTLLEADLKQPVVIENKPGANGTLGATQLINAAPNGYQLSIVPIGIFRQPQVEKMQLQPLRHLTYIASLVDYSYAIAVNSDSPWRDVPELIAAMKATNTCTYGTPGVHSTPHLAAEDFAKAAGFECTHIPYKGASEATSALLGKQVHMTVGAGGGSLDAQVKSGRLRILATLGEERAPMYPQVKTLKESGVPVIAAAPFGLVGPAGMDPRVVTRLADAVKKAMDDKSTVDLVMKNSAVLQFMGPKDYLAYANRTWDMETKRFGHLAKK